MQNTLSRYQKPVCRFGFHKADLPQLKQKYERFLSKEDFMESDYQGELFPTKRLLKDVSEIMFKTGFLDPRFIQIMNIT